MAQRLQKRLQSDMRHSIRLKIEAARKRENIDGANAGSRTRMGVNPSDPKSDLGSGSSHQEPTNHDHGSSTARGNSPEQTGRGYDHGYSDRYIPLGCGTIRAIIDASDYDLIRKFHWSGKFDRWGNCYARTSTGQQNKTLFMHRLLMNAQPGERIDHRNGDTLDNRRENLRLATNAQNVRNQKVHRDKQTSKFKGVYFRKDTQKYQAQIMCMGRKINLGQFPDEESAALVYDQNARKLFGEFARLNFKGVA